MGTEEEVPAVCERCLGDNPYLKMIREPQGEQCKLCTRPFTVFKWNTNRKARHVKTIICQTCSRQRNCCQLCMLDLTYGISTQLRDAAFKMAGVQNDNEALYSKNDVTKRYNAQKEDAKYLSNKQNNNNLMIEDRETIDAARLKAHEVLMKLSEAQKMSTSNKSSKMSHNSKKDSNKPSNFDKNDLAKVDISKILSKLPFNGTLKPPKSMEISSFFIFGINDELTNTSVTDYVSKLYLSESDDMNAGKFRLKSVVLNHKSKCGYIVFDRRSQAESFAKILQNFTRNTKNKNKIPALIIVRNIPIRICWGKLRNLGESNLEQVKLASIVRKQMKLLAEKEKKF